MIKINKRLRILVDEMVKASVNKDGVIDEKKVLNFVKAIKKFPLSDSIPMLSLFKSRLETIENNSTLFIETSYKISEELEEEIARSFKKDFTIRRVVNIISPNLIGGLRIKIGDTLIDNSIVGKISQIKERIVYG